MTLLLKFLIVFCQTFCTTSDRPWSQHHDTKINMTTVMQASNMGSFGKVQSAAKAKAMDNEVRIATQYTNEKLQEEKQDGDGKAQNAKHDDNDNVEDAEEDVGGDHLQFADVEIEDDRVSTQGVEVVADASTNASELDARHRKNSSVSSVIQDGMYCSSYCVQCSNSINGTQITWRIGRGKTVLSKLVMVTAGAAAITGLAAVGIIGGGLATGILAAVGAGGIGFGIAGGLAGAKLVYDFVTHEQSCPEVSFDDQTRKEPIYSIDELSFIELLTDMYTYDGQDALPQYSRRLNMKKSIREAGIIACNFLPYSSADWGEMMMAYNVFSYDALEEHKYDAKKYMVAMCGKWLCGQDTAPTVSDGFFGMKVGQYTLRNGNGCK